MVSIDKWIVALCFGAVAVAMYSWVRFDEPSYDSQSEYFARYKPRFSTSSKRYWRAKWGYVGAITLLYVILSLVPEILTALAGIDGKAQQAKLGETWVPLAAALALMTLENMPVLMDFERKIRGFLHAFARIPECVRRTVAQMKSSPFNFTPRALVSLTKKLGLPTGSTNNQPPPNLSTLLAEDDLLHTWYNVGALLCALSERNRDRSGIDPLFFESYKGELDSIADKHVALAELVRQHLAEHSPSDGGDSTVVREIRELRDRLYTFIACGVHSSVKTDAQSLEIVKRLGFAVRPSNERKTSFVAQLAGLAFAALIVVSAFTGYLTHVFREQVVLPLPAQWQTAFPMPKDPLGFYAWSWKTAMFYFAAIMGALAIRNARVARREWFDVTNLQRETPILRYIMPTLVGTGLGALTLLAIAMIDAPPSTPSLGNVGKVAAIAAQGSLPWVPLATVMAFISLALTDCRLKKDRFWRSAVGRATCAAAAMAIVGFLTAELSVLTAMEAGKKTLGDPPDQVISAGHCVSLFIAGLIGLFVLVLCVIAQVAERHTARARCFAGHCVEVTTWQGSEFRMYFDARGAASLFARAHADGNAAPVQRRGHWQLFPEGTAVKWNTAEGEKCRAGEFGLISWYGDSLIYEGYAEGFAGTPDFVGQVHVRPGTESAMNNLLEAARVAASAALPPPSRPDAPQPAVADPAREGAIA